MAAAEAYLCALRGQRDGVPARGAPPRSPSRDAVQMPRALLIIDIQRDYFAGGAFPLVDPEAAAPTPRTS